MPIFDEFHLDYPGHLGPSERRLIDQVADRNYRAHRDGFIGLILSGSVGRGVATDRSDLDLYVVLSDDAAAGQVTARSHDVDEIPVALSSIESSPRYGSPDWWNRWSFAWSPILLDRMDGRVRAAARRQATLTPDEQSDILFGHDRLDGWINFAYRALKSDRDRRPIECRLDAVESVPWFLDVVFTLAARVRPYNKYLPWELNEHPLPGWSAQSLFTLVHRTLDGDPDAVRESFHHIAVACAKYDERHGGHAAKTVMDGWGPELDLFRR